MMFNRGMPAAYGGMSAMQQRLKPQVMPPQEEDPMQAGGAMGTDMGAPLPGGETAGAPMGGGFNDLGAGLGPGSAPDKQMPGPMAGGGFNDLGARLGPGTAPPKQMPGQMGGGFNDLGARLGGARGGLMRTMLMRKMRGF